jgi:hypothetical protein
VVPLLGQPCALSVTVRKTRPIKLIYTAPQGQGQKKLANILLEFFISRQT